MKVPGQFWTGLGEVDVSVVLRMVEEGLDVLPIDASFRIVRKQQDSA